MTLHEAIERCERFSKSRFTKGAKEFGEIADYLRELEEILQEREEATE